MSNIVTVNEASLWATDLLGRNVTPANISYLVRYGRVRKYGDRKGLLVNKEELQRYYDKHLLSHEGRWKRSLGDSLNWKLSFSEYKEAETTKHVHRLHPYKGKFIPQLVEYFLDDHTDEFKKDVFFKKNDIILDPFCGSGTTLVQANELGMHAIGIDVSVFNSFISNTKIDIYDLVEISKATGQITNKLYNYQKAHNNFLFENRLQEALKLFNNKYFPAPEYRRKVIRKEIDEKVYACEKEKLFLDTYLKLVKEFGIDIINHHGDSFIDIWYMEPVKQEINFVLQEILKVKNAHLQEILKVILSRTIRSCRATTHADLATLTKPVRTTYYCAKHGKICKPIFTLLNWWKRYANDTVKRLQQFETLRTNTNQLCLTGDSRNIDIIKSLESRDKDFAALLRKDKIAGVFSSPPYVGLIDYHEQHAYAYDLLGLQRRDEDEIGPLYKGQGMEARKSYVEGVVAVLVNSKEYLKEGYNIFLVANDKYNLYPTIAKKSKMKIVAQYKRPVLNRTEKDKRAFAEFIFHLREEK